MLFYSFYPSLPSIHIFIARCLYNTWTMWVFISFHFFTLAIYLLYITVQILIMLWRVLEGVISLLLPSAPHCPSPSKSKGLHAKSSLSPYTNDGGKHDAVNSALVSVQVVKNKVSHHIQDSSGHPIAGKLQVKGC